MAEEKKKTTRGRKKKTENVEKEEKVVKEEKVEVKKVEKAKKVDVETQQNEQDKDSDFKLWEVIVVMIVTALVGLFVGGYVTYQRYNGRRVSCRIVRKDVQEIADVYDELVNDYFGKVDKETIVDNAIAGMMNGLGDRYAAFLDEDTAKSLDEELKGKFIGLGVQITGNEEGQIVIISVFDDSPAAKNGLTPGDIILSMDSVSYDASNLNELTKKIKSSQVGDKKTFVVLRDGQELTIEVSLDEVEISSVSSYYVEREGKLIGVMNITNFADNTEKQIIKNYNELKENGAQVLIIDLRGNGGGYLTSAEGVTSLFLNKDMVIYRKSDGETVESIKNENERVIDLPVVLLVDYTTASSSEVLASSLRDNYGYEIVGTRTFGKGMIQKLESLTNGRYIKYSTLEWLTANGTKVEGVGLTPDYEIEWDPELEYDNQLEAAIDVASHK